MCNIQLNKAEGQSYNQSPNKGNKIESSKLTKTSEKMKGKEQKMEYIKTNKNMTFVKQLYNK